MYGENHFAYPWFENNHLTHLWYVSINLRNPPQAQPLQKHLLTPKHNITRIKTPKTQKLFERETCGDVNVFFVIWSVWRGRKHKFHNIEAREGSFGKENQGSCVYSRFRVSDFVQVPKQKKIAQKWKRNKIKRENFVKINIWTLYSKLLISPPCTQNLCIWTLYSKDPLCFHLSLYSKPRWSKPQLA